LGTALNYLLEDLAISCARVFTWTLLSFAGGIGIAWLCFTRTAIYNILMPLVNFLRHISPFCWIPIIILVAGIGEWPVGIVLLFSMLFNAIVIGIGIFSAVHRDILDTASLDGAGRSESLRYILIPLCLPEFINLFRVLWSVGWTAIIAAEMLGVRSGLGYRLLDFRYLLLYKEMLLYIVVIGGIGVAADLLLVRIQERLRLRIFGK